MRIVLDTNVLARAASGPPGLANQLVIACTQSPHDLVLSPFLISELSRVLRYDRVRRVHGMADDAIDQYLLDLQSVALLVLPPLNSPPVVSLDPQDDPVVATAVAGAADVLCTLDKHLHKPEVIAYCRAHGIDVLTDRELLARFRNPPVAP